MTVAQSTEMEKVAANHRWRINWWGLLSGVLLFLSAFLSITILHRALQAFLRG